MLGNASSRLRPVWQMIWLMGLAVVFLSPALKTGYWAEDLYHSISPRASTVLYNSTPCDMVMGHVKHTLLMGRFFPLTAALITTVHYVFHDVWQDKAFILAASILDLFLFYLLVHKLSGRRDYAYFAACVTIGLIQYRITIDPSLGFFGQMQLLIAAFFLSLLRCNCTSKSGGRSGGVWPQVWSSTSRVPCCTRSPMSSCCSISASSAETLPARTRDSGRPCRSSAWSPSAASRRSWSARLHPADIYWHRTDFDPKAIVRAIVHQTSAGLPLSYFLADPLKIFPNRGLGALLRRLLDGRIALVALPAFGLCYLCLRTRNSERADASIDVGWGWLISLGLILAVFPSLLISISPYHRASISPGVGWIPVLIQSYGVGLLLSGGLWICANATIGGGAKASWKCIVASLLVATIVGITYRANEEVARCFIVSPGTKRFRGELGMAGGGFHYQRLLLEAAQGGSAGSGA